MIQDRNLKPGTVLVAQYKKRSHRCEVVKGAEGKVAFRVGGKEYSTPSGAGSAVMGGVACNGWRFWNIEGQETKKPAKVTKKAAAKTKPKAKAKAPKPAKAKKGHTPRSEKRMVASGFGGSGESPVEPKGALAKGDGTNGTVKSTPGTRCGQEGCGWVGPQIEAADHAATHEPAA